MFSFSFGVWVLPQTEHEKPKAVKWRETFIDQKFPVNQQTRSLVKLLHFIAAKYLDKCTVIVLYDASILHEERTFLQELLAGWCILYYPLGEVLLVYLFN